MLDKTGSDALQQVRERAQPGSAARNEPHSVLVQIPNRSPQSTRGNGNDTIIEVEVCQ